VKYLSQAKALRIDETSEHFIRVHSDYPRIDELRQLTKRKNLGTPQEKWEAIRDFIFPRPADKDPGRS